jgi:hypothetical protein
VNFKQRSGINLMVSGTIVAGTLLVTPPASAAYGAQSASKIPGQAGNIALSSRTIHVAYTIRLEDQLLAALRYLPVTFKPTVKSGTTTTTTTSATSTTSTTTTIPSSTTTSTAPTTTTTAPTTTSTVAKPVNPSLVLRTTKLLRGSYVWRFNAITMLRPQWKVGTDNTVLRGALMHFQSVHGLASTGAMDTATWQTLLASALRGQYDPTPYGYVVVTQGLPQHLDLYVNGRHTYTSLVNTGISVATTENGTFPVYLRYATTTMSGTNPNGTKYHDTGIPWTSYFHGGDALHGFIRGSYGSPQSLGCVEMPFANAAKVWPYTPIGTLVTVK